MLEEHLVDGVFQLGHLDNLYAHLLAGFVVLAFVDRAAVTLPDVLVYLICVSLDSFHHSGMAVSKLLINFIILSSE